MDDHIEGNKSKKMYKVRCIVGTARVRMDRDPSKIVRHFRIHWVGYPRSDATWQPQSNLPQLKELCRDFMKNLTQQQKNYTVDEADLLDYDSYEPSLNKGSQSGAKGEQAGHRNRKKIQRRGKQRRSQNMSRKHSQAGSSQNASEDYAYRTPKKSEKQRQETKADPFQGYRGSYIVSQKDPKDVQNERIERVLRGIRCEDGEIEVLVEWQPSEDGNRRQEQFVPKKWVLHYFPQKMLEFYEKTVRWL